MALKKTNKKSDVYFEAVGRRKSATARARLSQGGKDKGLVKINEKDFETYCTQNELREIIISPLKETETLKIFYVSGKVNGGGIKSQAEAMRLGISRALLKFNPEFRAVLKQKGFLTRNPRVVERKKFGLKKARKAAQWSKR
ncbi:30S ribosomal protein S9 [Patescibacteria group bacterium]|nr:30S ribosomal protein S9 [Patescibacteria group bacterium]MBU2632978.1 30S ribosomal protein S9 [Patescibacteria group bacterium]